MKIGINLISLNPGKIGGMEQYIRNFIWFTANKPENYIIYLFLSENNYETFESSHNIKKIQINHTNHLIQMQSYIEKLNLDIWFSPLLILEPKYLSIPTVVNIPDIQHEFYPEFFEPEVLKWRKENFYFSAHKSNAVLTLSEYSKKTIVEKYYVPKDKVYSIYLDSSKEFYESINEDKNKEVKSKYKLPEKYLFYPANTWPHKNHINLLKSLLVLKDKYGINIKLILTGSKDKTHNSILKFIRDNNLGSQVDFLGYVPQDDLPYIYANAELLVFPSLFEGFGIPLLEAMRVNTPIICSNIGSIPEVVGDAALYFNPNDPDNIAQQINFGLDSNIREELIRKATKQVAHFSWEKCVDETLEVFKKVILEGKKTLDVYPLVSIITPSYNQGEFIRETIESVLSQDYPNIEYIIMDGGSNDETVDILKSYGDKLKWVSEPDGGQADAVNKGIKVANGEIIGWLNSDDTYLEGAIKKAVETFLQHPELGMVYGEGYHITKDGKIIDRYPTENFNYDRLAETCFICQPTGFLRRDTLIKVGLLDSNLHLCMDYELWMKVGKVSEVAYIPNYLATSRMYDDNKTLSRRDEVYKEVINTVKKYYGYVPISWLYGYADYLSKGKHNLRFNLRLLRLTAKYNYRNVDTFVKPTIHLIKKEIKQRLRKEIYKNRYEDGWVSKVYMTTMEIDNESKLLLKGRHLWPYKTSLKLKVQINDVTINIYEIKNKGDFSIEVDCSDLKVTGLATIKIIANKTFVPKKLGLNEDRRALAYIVEELEILNKG